MKNLLKIFVLITILFTAVTETVDAQTRRGRSATTYQDNQQKNNQQQTQGQIFDEHFDFKNDNPNNNCVNVNLATNQVSMSSEELETLWGNYIMEINGNDLVGSTEVVSSKDRDYPQRFYVEDAVASNIKISKKGDDVEIKFTVGDNPVYTVNVLGVVSGTEGDMFYGTYDNGKFFATVSLIRTPCPQ